MIGFAHSRLVARLQAIATLRSEDADRIARLPMTLQNLGDEHTIVRDGDMLNQCCMLVDGYLYRSKVGADGKRQILSWHVPGDVPDLYSLHLLPMDHNITSLGQAVVAFIPHAALRPMLKDSPQLTDIFWRETLVDAAVYREWVISLGKRDALGRIAHMICELIFRLRVVGLARDNKVNFPASQADIADATGMSTVHANRIIQQLRSLRLIEWESRLITVLDLKGLQNHAEFDGKYLHLQPAVADGD